MAAVSSSAVYAVLIRPVAADADVVDVVSAAVVSVTLQCRNMYILQRNLADDENTIVRRRQDDTSVQRQQQQQQRGDSSVDATA